VTVAILVLMEWQVQPSGPVGQLSYFTASNICQSKHKEFAYGKDIRG
jgi:hypothetical protein